jgi:hypothetical protein
MFYSWNRSIADALLRSCLFRIDSLVIPAVSRVELRFDSIADSVASQVLEHALVNPF